MGVIFSLLWNYGAFYGLPTSIKYWKEEFFFVHVSAFSGPMTFSATADSVADPVPYLSHEDWAITERLVKNFVKWIDHEEVVLGMAGMSPLWKKLRKKSC